MYVFDENLVRVPRCRKIDTTCFHTVKEHNLLSVSFVFAHLKLWYGYVCMYFTRRVNHLSVFCYYLFFITFIADGYKVHVTITVSIILCRLQS